MLFCSPSVPLVRLLNAMFLAAVQWAAPEIPARTIQAAVDTIPVADTQVVDIILVAEPMFLAAAQ